MKLIFVEFFKLKMKLRAWLGPILIFLLIIISFPLSVELSSEALNDVFYSNICIASLLTIIVSLESIIL